MEVYLYTQGLPSGYENAQQSPLSPQEYSMISQRAPQVSQISLLVSLGITAISLDLPVSLSQIERSANFQ